MDKPTITNETSDLLRRGVQSLINDMHPEKGSDSIADTAKRVAAMYTELLAGYAMNPFAIVNGALFDVTYDEMVVVSGIDFYSLCEHHLLPFYGQAHVGYLPGEKILGLSKIPRLVDMYARRMQVQERFTREIADTMQDVTGARGVGVVIQASHMCATIRGVKKPNVKMTTSAMLGDFMNIQTTRHEFMRHIAYSSGFGGNQLI